MHHFRAIGGGVVHVEQVRALGALKFSVDASFLDTIFGCFVGAAALAAVAGVGLAAAAEGLAGVAGAVTVGGGVDVDGCAASELTRASDAAKRRSRPGVVGGCFMLGRVLSLRVVVGKMKRRVKWFPGVNHKG